MTQSSLFILQYNVRNSKDDIMIFMLANSKIRDYDILTIQEFWRNACVFTSYNSFIVDFHLTYDEKDDVRVCFYINVKLNVNDWSIEHVFFDVCIIKLKIIQKNISRIVHIHNVYNASSISYSSIKLFSSLQTMKRLLNDDAKHVLLEDFNLHHSLWSKSIRFTQHVAVDQLIELFNTTHMQFCLSQSIIIWKARNSISTIDLMFMTNRFQACVTHCESRFDLNQFSDHILVFTIFTLKMKQTSITKKRVWKRLDYDKFCAHLLLLVVSSAFRSVNEIKNLTQKLQKSITTIIVSTVSLIKASFRAQSYWNQKCADVVQTIKRKRRKWTETHTENRWRDYLHASNIKKKIIAKKKKLKFRKTFETFTNQSTSFWRFARWARIKSHQFKKISKMSNLMQRDAIDNIIKTASNFDEKTNMLIKQFFSNTKQVDLSDTHAYRYFDVVFESKKVISKDEIRQTIKKSKSDSASKSDEIFNKMLKLLMKKLMFTLMSLFKICAEQNYHSRCFRKTHTIFLKKSNKSNYTNFKTYKFIALFNILNKTLKSIIVNQISNLAETHKLLFETQMSERRRKACETTLKFLTKQIHIVWNMNKNKMTTLLSLNVIDAYDHVSRERLIHNLRKKRISNWIIVWTDNFMQNRCTTLRINEQSTLMSQIKVDISQNSFVSFILYFFYNADILKIFERFKYKITIIDFVNDINILTYDTSITNNCRALKKTHVICELWTRRHDVRFASIKYELLHLAKNHKRFDMTITINVKNVIRKSTTIMRVLNVQLDIKLKWNSHIKKIQNKMITQMLALIRLTISTWKACFKKTKHVYSVVVRSVITYDSSTWHASHDRSDTTLFLTNKFINFQKQSLRTISEAFRATSRKILNVETQIQFIELHFAYLQTKIKMRLHENSHNALIIKHCDKIKRKLIQTRKRKHRQVDITSKERKRAWFAKLCAENESTMQNDNSMTNKSLKKTLHDKWKRFWSEYQTKNKRKDCVALTS